MQYELSGEQACKPTDGNHLATGSAIPYLRTPMTQTHLQIDSNHNAANTSYHQVAKLQLAQNSAARLIKRTPKRAHITPI